MHVGRIRLHLQTADQEHLGHPAAPPSHAAERTPALGRDGVQQRRRGLGRELQRPRQLHESGAECHKSATFCSDPLTLRSQPPGESRCDTVPGSRRRRRPQARQDVAAAALAVPGRRSPRCRRGIYLAGHSGSAHAQAVGDFSILVAVVIAALSCAVAAFKSTAERPAWAMLAVAAGCRRWGRPSGRPTASRATT